LTPGNGLREHISHEKDSRRIVPLASAAGSPEVLMARYQAGDFAAAAALISRMSPPLHRFLAARCTRRADADDLLQETWLRIHRVRQTYRTGEPVLPWFYAIARHVRVDHYRSARRSAALERSFAELAGTASVPDDEGAHATDELDALLAPLSASQRDVIELLKIAGLSLEEVARATSSSVGAVKQKVHRAYERLRREVGAIRPSKGQSVGL
jgi:RNA polymerase sigma-70 factor (ECF subfamily)